MTAKGLGINAHDAGIGSIINRHQLMVPPNQRPYAWEEIHVQTLFEDLSGAISSSDQPYFLGSVVLIQSAGDRLEVADGQQRLATTSILIAAIRDYLNKMGDNERITAEKYTNEYLIAYDEFTSEHTPKLRLNDEDNEFFLQQILIPENRVKRIIEEPATGSHKRLFRSAIIARKHVENIVLQFKQQDKAMELYRWVKYLRESAMVIAIIVPDTINAYTMFETLNDRGLRASQIDILKSALFGKAQDRQNEVRLKWSSMVSTIETVGDEDLIITYIRHYWTLSNGYTPEKELAKLVKNEVLGRQQAVTLITNLDETAPDYVALFNPIEYHGWQHIDKESRSYIYIITRILAVEQILPLLLSITRKFESAEIKLAVKILLSWSVRFIIAGSGGGGPLDRAYGQMSKEITSDTVKTAAQMKYNIRAAILRTDAEFEQSFGQARVTKGELARYYLRSLELYRQQQGLPELGGIIDDNFSANLEHILPQRRAEKWEINEQIAQQVQKRLGNMALLNPTVNVRIANKSFDDKKTAFAASSFLLTQDLVKFTNWGPDEIDERQRSLAKMAVKIWPH